MEEVKVEEIVSFLATCQFRLMRNVNQYMNQIKLYVSPSLNNHILLILFPDNREVQHLYKVKVDVCRWIEWWVIQGC